MPCVLPRPGTGTYLVLPFEMGREKMCDLGKEKEEAVDKSAV